MSFVFPRRIDLLKSTAETGQLLTITDSAAQHDVGTVYHDNVNNKTYVYAYNALGAAASDNDPIHLVPQYTGATGGHWTMEPLGDDTVKKASYVCVAAALIPSTYYGWVQVQGDVDVNASDTDVFTDEAWAVGDELYMTAGKPATAADTDFGVTVSTFALVQDSRASTDTDECTIYLIGREMQNTS